MTELKTSEQLSHEKKWTLEGHGAVLADYMCTDGNVKRTVTVRVGNDGLTLPFEALPLYLEALDAASKWMKECEVHDGRRTQEDRHSDACRELDGAA
jgi:hypothetical protein